jgi:hypothetical protein
MHHRILSQLYDFIQVIYSIKKHYAKVEYFSKHILFITIYVLLKLEFNHNNYSVQEPNTVNFVQASGYEVHMYAKFEYSNVHRIL